VGHEEQVAFKAFSRATHPDMPDTTIKAIIARPSLPGRVFVEADSLKSVQKFAANIEELNRRVVRLVPYEDVPSIMYVRNPFSLEGKDWARIAGRGEGWSVYKGDIAMVVEHEGNKMVVVIPRIKTIRSKDRQRPEQALYSAHALKRIFGEDSIEVCTGDGSFTFKQRRYMKEGFLYCTLLEVDLYRPADDMPTWKELEIFRKCNLIEKGTLARTITRLEQMNIHLGARVFIVQGEFRGLHGRVTEVGEYELSVFIECLDHNEQVLKSSVRSTFRIGDEVRVRNGDHTGSVGWVVDVQQQMVTIINVEKDMEVLALLDYNKGAEMTSNALQASVSKTDVEFYNRPFMTTLRRRKPTAGPLLHGRDPNRIYHGKRVVVIGGTHYKSYNGIIKDTSPDGHAWVELEALQQQVVRLPLENLALL
jgi:ribosomal protein L24